MFGKPGAPLTSFLVSITAPRPRPCPPPRPARKIRQPPNAEMSGTIRQRASKPSKPKDRAHITKKVRRGKSPSGLSSPLALTAPAAPRRLCRISLRYLPSSPVSPLHPGCAPAASTPAARRDPAAPWVKSSSNMTRGRRRIGIKKTSRPQPPFYRIAGPHPYPTGGCSKPRRVAYPARAGGTDPAGQFRRSNRRPAPLSLRFLRFCDRWRRSTTMRFSSTGGGMTSRRSRSATRAARSSSGTRARTPVR